MRNICSDDGGAGVNSAMGANGFYSGSEMTMRALTFLLRISAPIFFLVGALHLAYGGGADALLGAKVSAETLLDPALNSQNRFYGVAFTVYGVLLLVCAGDLKKYQSVLRALLWVFLAAGIARILSIATHGIPPRAILALMGSELLLPPVILLWLRRAVAQN
jgi:hypothetical protein